jgi:membrane protein
VYGLPNRGFLRGKGIAAALMSSMIAVLFTSLIVGALGVSVIRHSAPGVAHNTVLAYTLPIAASLLGVFVFVLAIYRWLPNTPISWTEALPGAILGAVALEASFQLQGIFVRHADINVALRTLGGTAILIVWLFVMANVLVFGAELNWWWREHRRAAEAVPAPPVPGGS